MAELSNATSVGDAPAPTSTSTENGPATMAAGSSKQEMPPDAAGDQVSGPKKMRDNLRGQRQKGRGGGRGRGRGRGRGGRGGHADSRGGSQALKTDRREIHQNKRQRRDEQGTATTTAADGEDGEDGDDDTTPREKRRSNMSIPFSAEEIAAEDRRPKRKVAVLIGYAGTGYKGMQINHDEKTIEGDLFAAFVAAGAIQKRNADDPKKSSFVRCARTDKGVHAAGNVISLKLTIEDADIVDKINANLPEQIRIWGIQRTNNAFNCYQACDSRWYEYLLPSYALLPPHPQTFLGKKVIQAAKDKGVWDDVQKAWNDVKDYWDEVEKNDIKPILDRLDDKTREEVLQNIHADEHVQGHARDEDGKATDVEGGQGPLEGTSKKGKAGEMDEPAANGSAEDSSIEKLDGPVPTPEVSKAEDPVADEAEVGTDSKASPEAMEGVETTAEAADPVGGGRTENADDETPKPKYQPTPAEIALKEIKATYITAKRRYRVTPARIAQLQAALDEYQGTNNFHNYTIQKTFKDPSAKRHIKSFVVNPKPIQIRDTEWLSLKVHGQSFMMHQIRKMVAMAVLCVRCAVPLERIKQSYGPNRISIPKAPGLGLLLERPVFESYSKKAQDSFGREALNFDKYEKEIEEFKHRQIYTRIWDTEEKEASFHVFIHQLDSFNTDYFLWVTAHGFDAAYEPKERHDPKQKSMLKVLEQELVGDDEGTRDGDGNEG